MSSATLSSSNVLPNTWNLDAYLFLLPLVLASIGLVMVASASIDFAATTFGDPWYFTKRHAIFLVLALSLSVVVFSVPIALWNRYSIFLLILGLGILAAVLFPAVGRSVNGAQRWISLGGFSIQASEIAKFCFIVFFASFLSRRTEEFQDKWHAFFKLILILGLFVFLLLREPDFGSSVVLSIIAGAMMFVAGVPIIRFLLLGMSGIAGLAVLAVASPYRWQRLVTFLDPWAEQFSHGYQLVQSLIAFGRGEWFGLGLGNSLQKLFYLPEAHTDFIFAIVAEELGLTGAVLLIAIFAVFIWRIFRLAYDAHKSNSFISLCAVGIGVLFAAQCIINMGVASGLLPTKGLTLPFISSGGSSLIVSFAFVALLLKMDWEHRHSEQS